MNTERNIVSRLMESREQNILSYKGCNLRMDFDNIIHVYKNSKHLGEFQNEHEAIEFIDDLKNSERNPKPKSRLRQKLYVIYVSGTLHSDEAIYIFRTSPRTRKCSEGEADTYTEKEKNAIMRNSSKLSSYCLG